MQQGTLIFESAEKKQECPFFLLFFVHGQSVIFLVQERLCSLRTSLGNPETGKTVYLETIESGKFSGVRETRSI